MTTQFEQFENITPEEFEASYNFWMNEFRFIFGNILLHEMGATPTLIADMETHNQLDEYFVIYNLAILTGILKTPKQKDKASDD